MDTAVGTFTTRDLGRLVERIDAVGEAGYEGVELAETVEETAAELDRLADAFADRGIDLLYHHHSHEFVDCGGETAFSRLAERTSEVGFVLDVGWARLGGADPAALVERYGDRTGTIHVTDVADGPLSHDTDTERGVRLGEGDRGPPGVDRGRPWRP
jgi:sugar phosphate isomerase/epimerase